MNTNLNNAYQNRDVPIHEKFKSMRENDTQKSDGEDTKFVCVCLCLCTEDDPRHCDQISY